MKREKSMGMAGIFIILVIILAGVPACTVCAEDYDPAAYYENNSVNITRDHYFQNLKIMNLKLYGDDDRVYVKCQIINMGEEIFGDGIDFYFYDFWGQQISVCGYSFPFMGEELAPGEVKTVSFTILEKADWVERVTAVRFRLSRTKEKVTRGGIIQDRVVENVLIMEQISLTSNKGNFGYWDFSCSYRLAEFDPGYAMPAQFDVYLIFKDRKKRVIEETTVILSATDVQKGVNRHTALNEDLSEAYYLEVKTNLPVYTPSETPDEKIPEASTLPSQVSTVSKNSSGLVLTVLPVYEKEKIKLLKKPAVYLRFSKYGKNMWMAKIRLKKYQGTHIEIYYRRGKGKYRKIKLKQSNIKKNKNVFTVGYRNSKKPIYIRVRTYQKKGKTKRYSAYSNLYRLKKRKK